MRIKGRQIVLGVLTVSLLASVSCTGTQSRTNHRPRSERSYRLALVEAEARIARENAFNRSGRNDRQDVRYYIDLPEEGRGAEQDAGDQVKTN